MIVQCKGLFTPSESEHENKKDQIPSKRDQRKNSNIEEKFRFRVRFPSALADLKIVDRY